MMSQALHEKNAILRLRILLLREQSSDGNGDSTAPIASLRVKCLEAESLGHQSLENPGHLGGGRRQMFDDWEISRILLTCGMLSPF